MQGFLASNFLAAARPPEQVLAGVSCLILLWFLELTRASAAACLSDSIILNHGS
jgi:hypothetical protein